MNNEYYMKYVNNYINNYISITNNVFVALHSFLQFYDKAVLLQQTHWGHEIIKGSGGLCLTGCLTLRTLGRPYSPRNWISWCVFLVSSLERLHEDSAFHHHHDEPQGLCPRAKHPQCHGHENAKLNHRWSNIVPWEEWVHVDTIKALLLHFGGVSWACTEPSSDPSPSGALGDRLQQLSIVTSSCAHAGELLPSWKTSFCHFCDCQAESQLSVCSGSLPPCLRWASTVLPCSTATPWSCPRAFLCCCTAWPMNVHVWARGSAGAASERGWLTGDEMLGLDTCFSWSLF